MILYSSRAILVRDHNILNTLTSQRLVGFRAHRHDPDLPQSAREDTRMRLQHIKESINASLTHEDKPINRTLADNSREFTEDTRPFQGSQLDGVDDERGPAELSHKP